MMGGSAKIIAKGQELYDQGQYLLATEILNKLVYAEPKNQPAKDLLADVFEQIGYQKESPSVRNSFLAGAFELRNGIPSGASPKTAGPDMIRAMTTELWLDFLGIRLDSKKADGINFVINLVTPDNSEEFVVELSNATLTNIKGVQAKNPDLTVIIDRTDLEKTMMGVVSMDEQIKAGKAKLVGDRKPIDQLKSMLVQFDMGFEILPGTGAKDLTPEKDPFAHEPPAVDILTD
jgi:alkyl sulfatase BDS1-like metallo-beta-lactamase superfamily hydrolase